MATNTPETPENVATEATQTAQLSLSRLMLIGTSGPDQQMSALVRLSGGRIVKVAAGDRVDGGKVQFVAPSRMALARRGRIEILTLPGG